MTPKITVEHFPEETVFEVGKLYKDRTIVVMCTNPDTGMPGGLPAFAGIIMSSDIETDKRLLIENWSKDSFILVPHDKVISLQNPPAKPVEFVMGQYYELSDKQVVKCCGLGIGVISFETIDGHPAFDMEYENAKSELRLFHGIIHIDTRGEK